MISIKNIYTKVFCLKPVDWHIRVQHRYHVSEIGVDNSKIPADEHYGPCLRDTFYKILDQLAELNQHCKIIIEDKYNIDKNGTLKVGDIIHEHVQKIQKAGKPCIVEFPLFVKAGEIELMGSVDLLEFKHSFNPMMVDVNDIKTASDHTFPKHENDKNPTYMGQINIYAAILDNYIFGDFIQIRKLKITIIRKRDLYTVRLKDNYDKITANTKFTEFVNRAIYLDKCIEKTELPKKEPHKWCQYCNNIVRCENDCIEECDIVSYTEDEVMQIYHEKTGKNPIWRGNQTKAYQTFRGKFKIEN